MHLHFLVTEGGTDEAGVFHKIPRIDDSRLAEIFAREVLAMLVRKELLSPEWAERILSWRHSGFSVHSLVRAKTSEWKEALDGALCEKFPWGVRDQGLKLVSDNGSQPTSVAFMKDTAELGINQIFCSYDNPRGNAETERVIRTIKEEVLWLNDFGSFEEARATIGAWIGEDYNRLYVHSALGYRSPEEFRQQWIQSQEAVLGGC